mmetsp:Transcript_33723/g.78818  ORF Transcript_33723/g.78818 Transcript_33723/m.78818 type:complete len:247 (+) Transcript_33723:1029-1769(+)
MPPRETITKNSSAATSHVPRMYLLHLHAYVRTMALTARATSGVFRRASSWNDLASASTSELKASSVTEVLSASLSASLASAFAEEDDDAEASDCIREASSLYAARRSLMSASAGAKERLPPFSGTASSWDAVFTRGGHSSRVCHSSDRCGNSCSRQHRIAKARAPSTCPPSPSILLSSSAATAAAADGSASARLKASLAADGTESFGHWTAEAGPRLFANHCTAVGGGSPYFRPSCPQSSGTLSPA